MITDILKALPNELLYVAIACFGVGIFALTILAGCWVGIRTGLIKIPNPKPKNGDTNNIDQKLDCLSEEVKEDIIDLVDAKGYKDHEGVNIIITDRLKEEREHSDKLEKEREKNLDLRFTNLDTNISLQFSNMGKRMGDLEGKVDTHITDQSTFIGRIDEFIKTLEESHLTRTISDGS